MPSKNAIKDYKQNAVYHVYNRGVEKRRIFLTEQDYKIFHSFLKEKSGKFGIFIVDHVYVRNHFHLIVFQRNERDIEHFMQSAMLSYVLYFNKRYSRVGPLFQGRYRARLLNSLQELAVLLDYLEKNREKDEGLSF